MPKINVYLPDDLAEAVKAAGVPVSAVCQRALERAVGRMTSIREAVAPDFEGREAVGALDRFTLRARGALKLAGELARAGASPVVSTDHVLGGLLAEGGNLALSVLGSLDITPEQVARDLAARRAAGDPVPGSADERAVGDASSQQFSEATAAVLELATTEALSLGHNYIGCEHLLLGLVNDQDGVAGQVLRGLGAEPRLTRQAVKGAVVGYGHLKAQTQQGAGAGGGAGPAGAAAFAQMVRTQFEALAARIERIERRLDLAAAAGDEDGVAEGA